MEKGGGGISLSLMFLFFIEIVSLVELCSYNKTVMFLDFDGKVKSINEVKLPEKLNFLK